MCRNRFNLYTCCLFLAFFTQFGECEDLKTIPPTKPSGNAEFDRLVRETEKLLAENASLETITKHPDKSVAVTACWAYYNSPKLHGQLIDYHQLMKARKRFVGYLSTTIKHFPPDWWEESLIKESLEFNDSSLEEYRYHTDDQTGTEFREFNFGFFNKLSMYNELCLPDGATVTESLTEPYLLQIKGQKEIPIERKLMNEISKRQRLVKGINLKEGNVLLLYRGQTAPQITAYRLDAKGKLKWKTDLWGTHDARSGEVYKLGRKHWSQDGVYGVHEFHYLEGAENNGKLCVFGADFSGAYLEMFDLESGEALLRFSTVYLK